MQTFFHLNPKDHDEIFADASVFGTYLKNPPCPACGAGRWERIRPLVIEWEPGSTTIADFTWPACLGELVITDAVKKALGTRKIPSISFGPVEMYQNPKLKQPTRPNARSKARVWLPYSGPKLWDLEVKSYCHLNLEKSRRVLRKECELCKTQELDVVDPGAPLVIEPDTWDGAPVFRIREVGEVVFVLEDVKALLQAKRFTNLEMKPRGTI